MILSYQAVDYGKPLWKDNARLLANLDNIEQKLGICYAEDGSK